MAGTKGWGGIPFDRVVAVVANLDTGLVQTGSGYLVTERHALTARHCTLDERTGRPARSLRVVRPSDGAEATATVMAAAWDSDVAVLTVGEDPAWPVLTGSEPPLFGRVDRSHAGELHDCQALGFPLWQLDPRDQQRNTAELHGTIRVTEDAESGLLVMRDQQLDNVTVPATAATEDRADESTWGGLSGALVFWQGIALGVVIEHHPRKGRSAITILPVERFAAGPSDGRDPGSAAVAAALGLPLRTSYRWPGDGRWPTLLKYCFRAASRGWPTSTRTRSARPGQGTATLKPTGSAMSMSPGHRMSHWPLRCARVGL